MFSSDHPSTLIHFGVDAIRFPSLISKQHRQLSPDRVGIGSLLARTSNITGPCPACAVSVGRLTPVGVSTHRRPSSSSARITYGNSGMPWRPSLRASYVPSARPSSSTRIPCSVPAGGSAFLATFDTLGSSGVCSSPQHRSTGPRRAPVGSAFPADGCPGPERTCPASPIGSKCAVICVLKEIPQIGREQVAQIIRRQAQQQLLRCPVPHKVSHSSTATKQARKLCEVDRKACKTQCVRR